MKMQEDIVGFRIHNVDFDVNQNYNSLAVTSKFIKHVCGEVLEQLLRIIIQKAGTLWSEHHSTQSEIKTLVSLVPPLFRLLQKTIFFPLGENMGNASKPLSLLIF